MRFKDELVPWRRRADGTWVKMTFMWNWKWPNTEEGRESAEEWLGVYLREHPKHTVVISTQKPLPPIPDFMGVTG
jgi:hypothetical protein